MTAGLRAGEIQVKTLCKKEYNRKDILKELWGSPPPPPPPPVPLPFPPPCWRTTRPGSGTAKPTASEAKTGRAIGSRKKCFISNRKYNRLRRSQKIMIREGSYKSALMLIIFLNEGKHSQ
jgi:hypothetical protein